MATDPPVTTDRHGGSPVAWSLQAVLLGVFFLMLWLPVGQEEFLADHWMKVGAFLAPLVLFFLLLGRAHCDEPWFRDTRFLAGLLTTGYLIHQIEEHWVDLLGRVYPLYDLLNELLRDRIDESSYGAMTPEALFFINTALVWLPGFLAIFLAPRYVFPTLAMAGLVLVNGVAHLAQGALAFAYNPGLLTGLVIFIPISVTTYLVMFRRPNIHTKHLMVAIVWGVGAHALLIVGVVVSVAYGWVPVGVYYASLIVWAFLPTLVFRKTDTRV